MNVLAAHLANGADATGPSDPQRTHASLRGKVALKPVPLKTEHVAALDIIA